MYEILKNKLPIFCPNKTTNFYQHTQETGHFDLFLESIYNMFKHCYPYTNPEIFNFCSQNIEAYKIFEVYEIVSYVSVNV